MFESEDWNFDEELLEDEKVLQFCSQVENEETEQPAKKRKLNECQNINISTKKIWNETQSLTNSSKGNVNRVDENNPSRTNFVLGIFQQNSQKKVDDRSEYKSHNRHDVSDISNHNNISQNNINSQIMNRSKLENGTSQQTSRKNIVLDILKRKNLQNQTDNSSKLSTCVTGITSLHSSNQKVVNEEKSEVYHNAILQKSNSYPQSMHTSSFFRKNETVNISPKIKNCNQKLTVSEEHKKPEESVKKESINLEHSINKQVNDSKQDISQESRKHLLMQHLKPSTLSNEGFIIHTKPTSFISKTEKQPTKKTTLVRKFPGPAGLLPDVIDNSLLSTLALPNLEDSKAESVQCKKNTSITEYCSQNTKTLFTEGAWQMMLNDIPPGLLENYEIAEIKEIASENQQECTKIPFLAGIIESIDYSHANPLIVLKDFTDTIEGIIHADIPIKYPGALDKSVVILLQNVGLLCISGALVVRKYHILISPLNLLAIYSHKGDVIRTPQMEFLRKQSDMLESGSINLCTEKQREKLSPANDHCDATCESLDESFNCDIDSDFQIKDNFDNSRLSIEEVSMKEEKENIHDNESPLEIPADTPTKHLKGLELDCVNKTLNGNKKQNNLIRSRLSAFRCKDVLTQVESNSENMSENKSIDKKSQWAEDILCNSENDSDDEMLSQLDVDNMF